MPQTVYFKIVRGLQIHFEAICVYEVINAKKWKEHWENPLAQWQAELGFEPEWGN
jgi:ubiquinone biosynthesis protein Coq4